MTTELLNKFTAGFGDLKTFSLQALNVILPIAFIIFGIMFVWFLITKFFLRLVHGKRPARWDEVHTGDMWDRDTEYDDDPGDDDDD